MTDIPNDDAERGRWRFFDPSSTAESQHRRQVEKKIDAWWKAFGNDLGRIHDTFTRRKSNFDLPGWMANHLQAIHPQLMWEFGPAVKDEGHRLVITPEVAYHLRPLTDTVLERAPKIDGWEFYGYRLPENVETAQQTVNARTGGSLEKVFFQAALGKHNLIDVTFFCERYFDNDDRQGGNDAFVATEALLGEETLDKWIGVIAVSPLPAKAEGEKGRIGDREKSSDSSVSPSPLLPISPSSLKPLSELSTTVEKLIAQVRGDLPATPCYQWKDSAGWSMFRAEPEQAEDYPLQSDIFVGKSANEKLWIAAHSPGTFFSERFSKHGESFCCVKLDGAEGLDEEKFADKAEIEDALDEVLIPRKLGCQIGGGTGLRYSYIDLALTDLDEAIEAVRGCLRAGNVPKRSWILFFDSYLGAEWIGIYEDTPAPPM